MNVALISIDCATSDSKVGLALSDYDGAAVVLRGAGISSRAAPAADRIVDWVRGYHSSVLFAIDAPLGWPAPMGDVLIRPLAGQPVNTAPNEMFRRTTDRFMHDIHGKTPLDVGADRIARTAHSALTLLATLSRRLDCDIPLVWTPGVDGVRAIEVYPAATLIAHGFRSSGYKQPAHIGQRREMVAALDGRFNVADFAAQLTSLPDALDATVCILAAKDFLEDRCPCPANRGLAEREDWIWTSMPTASLDAVT